MINKRPIHSNVRTSVMGFADIMRASPFAKGWRINTAIDCCNAGKTGSGVQADSFIELMRKAISMRDR